MFQTTMNAECEPHGASRRLNRARVFVTGSLLEQAARATADRKALGSQRRQHLRTHGVHQVDIWSTPSEAFVGSYINHLRGGFFYPVTLKYQSSLCHIQMTTKIANILFVSPEATRIGISPSSHTFTCSCGGPKKNEFTRRSLLPNNF